MEFSFHTSNRRVFSIKDEIAKLIHILRVFESKKDSYDVEKRVLKQGRFDFGPEIVVALFTNDTIWKYLLVFITHTFRKDMARIESGFRRFIVTPYATIRNKHTKDSYHIYSTGTVSNGSRPVKWLASHDQDKVKQQCITIWTIVALSSMYSNSLNQLHTVFKGL